VKLPPANSVVSLLRNPLVAAIQIAAVITSTDPKQAQRAAHLFLTWHRQAAYAAGIENQSSGVRPARIDQLLAAPEKRLRRRFQAAQWAMMIAAKTGPIKLRFGGAPDPGVRVLARWANEGAEGNVIRDVWSSAKPVLAMILAIRGRFDHTPTLADICFNSAWVAPALDAEPLAASWLEAVPELEYRAADRVEFNVPNLISEAAGQSK
jgi:hypothetical protein